MSLKKQKAYLVVLDVGHGSSAVLHDEGGTVVFDTGRGAHVARHLDSVGVERVQAMFLSHADADHIGGAMTLLLDKRLHIREVFLNPDSSKDSAVFEQLGYALMEAKQRSGTRISLQLTTSTQISRKGSNIEILHPPDLKALSGVGGKSASGKRNSSNSMSAAIRVSRDAKSSVLLCADVEFDCLDEWKTRQVKPTACVLVFPHHGGLPDTSNKAEAALFGFQLTQMVSPEFVIFSNHRSKFGNPQNEVLAAISKAAGKIRFACTQLPERLHQYAQTNELWSLHKSTECKVIEGSICLEFQKDRVRFCFGEAP